MIAKELYQASKLRKINGNQIAEQYAGETIKKFEQAAKADQVLSVVVRVRDEQEDLPATLLALSRSKRPVVAIVASNGSVDNTVEIAKRMVGEDNVLDIKEPGLMNANQQGVQYAQRQYGSQVVLFTDGDTLMPAHWAGAMEKRLNKKDAGNGAYITGRVIWAHGKSRIVDAAITIKSLWDHTRAKIKHQVPRANGANQGVRFDPGGSLMEQFMSLDPSIFFHEELALRDVATTVGANISYSIKPSLLGITRGDRCDKLSKVFGKELKRRAEIYSSYRQQYGDTLNKYIRS